MKMLLIILFLLPSALMAQLKIYPIYDSLYDVSKITQPFYIGLVHENFIVTKNQRDSITEINNLPEGVMIYCKDCIDKNKGIIQVWDGKQWKIFSDKD